MTSHIKMLRRERQAKNIPSDYVTDHETKTTKPNPEVFIIKDDGTITRKKGVK